MLRRAAGAHTYILTLSCLKTAWDPARAHRLLFAHDCDIVEHQQFDDPIRAGLFMRTEFVSAQKIDATELRPPSREEMAGELGMSYKLDDDRPQRALVMVSQMGHCLK